MSFYATAIGVRRGLIGSDDFAWRSEDDPEALHFQRNGWSCITNFSFTESRLPEGPVLFSSTAVNPGVLPAHTTVWLRHKRELTA